MEQKNNINNIISPLQRIMRTNINDNDKKHDTIIYTQTKLITRNDNLQYQDTHTINNNYCPRINTSHSQSFIHHTKQLIYFFSCGHKKTINLNKTPSYYQTKQLEFSHRSCHTTTYFHCIKMHKI